MKTILLTSKQREFLIQQRIKDPSRKRKISLKWGRGKATPRSSLEAPPPSRRDPPGARARLLIIIRREPSPSPTRKTARFILRSEEGPGPGPRWPWGSARPHPWSRGKFPRSGANLSRWWPVMWPRPRLRPFRGHIDWRRGSLMIYSATPSQAALRPLTVRETTGSRNSLGTTRTVGWCRGQVTPATHRHWQGTPALVGCQIILSASIHPWPRPRRSTNQRSIVLSHWEPLATSLPVIITPLRMPQPIWDPCCQRKCRKSLKWEDLSATIVVKTFNINQEIYLNFIRFWFYWLHASRTNNAN